MRISPIHDGELVTLGFLVWAIVWFWWGDWYLAFLLFTVAYGAAMGSRWAWAWRVGEWEDGCERRLEEIDRSTGAKSR